MAGPNPILGISMRAVCGAMVAVSLIGAVAAPFVPRGTGSTTPYLVGELLLAVLVAGGAVALGLAGAVRQPGRAGRPHPSALGAPRFCSRCGVPRRGGTGFCTACGAAARR